MQERHIRASLAAAALLVAVLLVPAAMARAASSCASLDIELRLAALPEFTTVDCDSGSFRYGGPSHTEEVIAASGPASLFIIHHFAAGVRTYIERRDTKSLIEDMRAFETTGDWRTGPGGKGFFVMRFNGRLARHPDLPLTCFGFSRFSGHVPNSSGYRHMLAGYYCMVQAGEVSEPAIRQLLGALAFDFE